LSKNTKEVTLGKKRDYIGRFLKKRGYIGRKKSGAILVEKAGL
jgi:hypothetical protein